MKASHEELGTLASHGDMSEGGRQLKAPRF